MKKIALFGMVLTILCVITFSILRPNESLNDSNTSVKNDYAREKNATVYASEDNAFPISSRNFEKQIIKAYSHIDIDEDDSISIEEAAAYHGSISVTGATEPSTIYGIEHFVNITSLNFSTNNISSRIPENIGNLTKLTNFQASGNNLYGEIPESFYNLKELTRIGLYATNLSGEISSSIGNLIHLTDVSFSTNQFTGQIPESIGNLKKLTYISLSRNYFTGPIPDSIGNLINLTRLSLQENDLTGPIPGSIGNLKKLTQLNLADNKLTGPIPSSMYDLGDLQKLRAGFNQLSGEISTLIGNLGNLTDLNLSHNQLEGALPTQLGSLKKVKNLDLSYNKFSGALPTELSGMTDLVNLELAYNAGMTGNLESFKNHTKVALIDILGTNISISKPTASLLKTFIYGVLNPTETDLSEVANITLRLLANAEEWLTITHTRFDTLDEVIERTGGTTRDMARQILIARRIIDSKSQFNDLFNPDGTFRSGVTVSQVKALLDTIARLPEGGVREAIEEKVNSDRTANLQDNSTVTVPGGIVTLPNGGTVDVDGIVSVGTNGIIVTNGVVFVFPNGGMLDTGGIISSTTTYGIVDIADIGQIDINSDDTISLPRNSKVMTTIGEFILDDGGVLNADGTVTIDSDDVITLLDSTTKSYRHGAIINANGTITEIIFSFDVSFDSNGGSAVLEQTIVEDAKATAPTIPTKEGYTFSGWYTDVELTQVWNFSSDAVTENMTLYAKWTINTFVVEFQTNGGSSISNETINYGTVVTRPTNPTKTGSVFDGWYTDAALTLTWDFDAELITQTSTIYAKWVVNTHVVSFDTDGGTFVNSQLLTYGSFALIPVVPTKDGSTFEGWYKDAACTVAWDFATNSIDADTVIYAKWQTSEVPVEPAEPTPTEPTPIENSWFFNIGTPTAILLGLLIIGACVLTVGKAKGNRGN